MKKILILIIILLFLGGCEQDNQIIIYTNSNQTRTSWYTEYAKEEGFNVKIITLGGYDMYHRLLAEKNEPYADVFFGVNIPDAKEMEELGMLEKFTPDWKDDLVYKVNSDYFYPLVTDAILLYYNKSIENPPETYSDLTNPIYDHKYTIKRFGGYTSRLFIGQILLDYVDESGELNINEEGWTELEQIINNCVYAKTFDTSLEDVIDNTIPMAITNAATLAAYQLNNPESNIGIVSNNNEVLYTYSNVGILKNNNNTEASIEFVKWLGSEKVQLEYAKEFGLYTNNGKAREQLPEELLEFYEQLPEPFEYDTQFYNDNIDSWIKKLDIDFVEKLRY